MERSQHRDAARVLEALWPTGRPSPRLSDSEIIELRALWREVRLEEWERVCRRFADDGARLRPHVAELRHAARIVIRERIAPKALPKLPPPPANREEALERVAALREKLNQMGTAC